MYRFLRANITEISICNRFEFRVNPRAIPLARVGQIVQEVYPRLYTPLLFKKSQYLHRT